MKTPKEHYHEPSFKKIFGWKIKEMELEKQVSSQRLKLTSDLFKLKKKKFLKKKDVNVKGSAEFFMKNTTGKDLSVKVLMKNLQL